MAFLVKVDFVPTTNDELIENLNKEYTCDNFGFDSMGQQYILTMPRTEAGEKRKIFLSACNIREIDVIELKVPDTEDD